MAPQIEWMEAPNEQSLDCTQASNDTDDGMDTALHNFALD